MERCSSDSSCFLRRTYINWCVDSATSAPPLGPPPTTGESPPQSPGPGLVPPPLLSPLDQDGGDATETHQLGAVRRSWTEDGAGLCGGGERDDRGEGGGGRSRLQKEEEEENYHLPRSSPVISRRTRALCRQGGGTTTPHGTSSDRYPPVDQHGGLMGVTVRDLGPTPSPRQATVRDYKEPRPASVRPPCCGLQGLTEEHWGRGLGVCGSPPLTAAPPRLRRPGLRCSSLLDLPADVFQSSCDVDQENAHFVVVDLVLEVLEAVRWTLSSQTTCTQPHANCARDGPPHARRSTHALNATAAGQEEEASNHREKLQNKTQSVGSTDSGFKDCGLDASSRPTESLSSAERQAQQLVLDFRRTWFPLYEPRRGRQSLRSSLQELPGAGGVVASSSSSLQEEIRLRTRMRGSLNWAPPRLQIIFTLQPSHRRSEVVAAQNFLCAGCGTEVEPRHIKKLRYCEYLGRYFCACCHAGSEAVIPARVLTCWDFTRYPVSEFSRQLLDSLWLRPLFHLSQVSRRQLGPVKELRRFKEVQEQLVCVKKLLRICRFSGRVLAEIEHLPPHLMELPQLFSMDDLWKVKTGQLVLQVRALMEAAELHIWSCEVCLARGFICEFCRENDIIFPFQSHTCAQCSVCRSCFHKHCLKEKKCPKCTRIQSCVDGSMT